MPDDGTMMRTKGKIYPSWRLAAYAFPAVPISAIGIPLVAYLPAYYATEAGLSLSVVGTIFLIVRLADIGLDPLIGAAMDRNRTRWGRFRPWLVAGAPPMAVAAVMLFSPLGTPSITYLTLWLAVAYGAYSVCYLSHLSWGMSLSTDYNERSRIFAFWQGAALLGSISVLGTPIIVEGWLKQSHAAGIAAMGFLIAGLLLVSVVTAVVSMREPPAASDKRTARISDYLRLMVRPTIARLLITDLLIGLAMGMNSALFFFYFGFFKGFAQLDIVVLLFLNLCGSLCGTPIWTYLTDKIGKHLAASYAFFFYALSLILIQFTPANMSLMCFILFLAGLTLSAGPLLLRSMMADAGDEELLRSGQDQTGVLSALFSGTNKIGLALAPGLTFLILGLFNFSTTEQSSDSALGALQALYILVPVVLGVGVAFIIRGHPLTAETHANVMLLIKQSAGFAEKGAVSDGSPSRSST